MAFGCGIALEMFSLAFEEVLLFPPLPSIPPLLLPRFVSHAICMPSRVSRVEIHFSAISDILAANNKCINS